MVRPILIARDNEIQRLQKCMNETNAQLVILYGRRRVGKTYLINCFFERRFDFKVTGMHQEKRETQLKNFATELSDQMKEDIAVPKDWTDAFRLLRNYLKSLPEDEKHVVFFDEFPWFDTRNSGFLSAFEHFWNDFGCSLPNLILIICGSATTWMTKNIAMNQGGLFLRHTCSMYLQQFNLKQTEEYLHARGIEWSRYDIIRCYMILGGIPYYLSLLDADKSLNMNIDNLFFRKRAELWNEFNLLYKTLFKNSKQYMRIVETLGKKRNGMTRQEISQATGMTDNGNLTDLLDDLENSDFLRVTSSFGKEKKEMIYQLCDYCTLFYIKFIKGYRGRDEHFWSHTYGSPSVNAWSGLTFEQVCKDHIEEIKRKIGISAVLTNESTWFLKGDEERRGTQIDLIIDRNDHFINLCEMKYSDKEYVIDKDYDGILRERLELFRKETKTRKTIQYVFITSFGVKANKYSNIISSQVTLDDLFS